MKPREISRQAYLSHCDGSDGICCNCGSWTYYGVDPETVDDECGWCGEEQVMGVELALKNGIIAIGGK